MKKYTSVYILLLMFVFANCCNAQNTTGSRQITRNVIQDKKGNIWIAAFDGVFRYDGKLFTNITGKVSSARFFSVLEDSKGNMWFGSIGAGAYCYDGKSFRNFTTRDGLPGNDITYIYEDKAGDIWFGTNAGASRYNGKSFKNLTTKDGLPDNDTNCIIEDKTGKFWIGMRGKACIYDGKTVTVLTHDGKPFTNVRTIMEDKKGNIWLGGADGLWRYDSRSFTNFTHDFVGYIMEDKKGNIWISSEKDNSHASAFPPYGGKSSFNRSWAIYRYDGNSLLTKKLMITEILSKEAMICGILEANDGSIWFGSVDGVYRYDGGTHAYAHL